MTEKQPLAYTSTPRPTEPIQFTLDDDLYHFTPHKIASTVLPMMDADAAGTNGDYRAEMSRETWKWLRDGLPAEEYDRIIGRLKDPKDPLDYADVARVANDLVREVSGRPTKRRSG